MSTLGLLLGAALLRVAVDAPGPCEVPAAAVTGAGLSLAACDLYGGATETAIPILERDGGFVFVAPTRTRHSRRTTFVLRPRPEGAAPARIAPGATEVDAPQGYDRIERNEIYDPLEVKERTPLDPFGYGGADYFYWAAPKAVQEFKVDLPPAVLPKDGEVPLEITIQGDRKAAASNGVDLSWNGEKLGKTERWAGPKAKTLKLTLDAKRLRASGNTLKLDARDGRLRLDAVRVGFTKVSLAGAKKPIAADAITPEDLRAGGADWVAISVDGAREALAPLAAHRESQGLKTRIVRLQDIFDTFSAGNFDPRAIRRFVEATQQGWSPKPRFLLLVGEATRDVDFLSPTLETLPAALVDTCENGASATDNWYGALEGDRTVPQVAIGRFPASDAATVKRLVDRTIAYETRAPYGPWRRKLSFVAGEGRFGEAVDKAIEDLALQLFNEYVPQGYQLNMTYASVASPYLWVPKSLTEKVVERMNEGSAILNYTGHGQMEGFDDLRFRGKRYPLFHSEDVAKVKCTEKRPLVLITACWTGCYDDPEQEPVGELLFEHEKGAAAVFASSRVSHPFSNAVLSKELVAGLFGEKAKGRRLGEAILEVKRLMLEAKDQYRDAIAGYGLMFLGDPLLLLRLLKDDCQLFNLLGDPALVPPFPKGEVKLAVDGKAMSGKPCKIKGSVEGMADGKAIVSFEVQRKTIRGELEPVEIEKPGFEKRIQKNYAIANDKVVATKEVDVAGGAFEVSLDLPDDLMFVKHFVKAYAWNDKGDALGALEVEVDEAD